MRNERAATAHSVPMKSSSLMGESSLLEHKASCLGRLAVGHLWPGATVPSEVAESAGAKPHHVNATVTLCRPGNDPDSPIFH